MAQKGKWLIFPLAFPLMVPCVWPGSLLLVEYLERGKPIELDSKQWECTKSHTVIAGMMVADVCDEYSRRK